MDAANKLTGGVVGAGVAQRDAFEDLSAATTLTVSAARVHVTGNTASDDWSLTLPPVAEAAGRFLSIYATIANSKTVTVQDQDDSVGWTDLTLDTDDDHALLYSDGLRWCVILNGIA